MINNYRDGYRVKIHASIEVKFVNCIYLSLTTYYDKFTCYHFHILN